MAGLLLKDLVFTKFSPNAKWEEANVSPTLCVYRYRCGGIQIRQGPWEDYHQCTWWGTRGKYLDPLTAQCILWGLTSGSTSTADAVTLGGNDAP